MDTRSLTRLTHSSGAASTAWLISFGDLLTLLVCFFLVLTQWRTESLPNSTRKSSVHTPLRGNVGPGTPFAESTVGRSEGVVVEMPVLGPSPLIEEDAARQSLRRNVQSVATLGNAVVFRVCDGEPGYGALHQFGSFVRESIDPPVVFRIEVVGDCRSFDVAYPTTGEVVGAVRFLKE